MADNKTLPPTGTGTANIQVATDEIAGVDYQKVKLVDGTADSTAAIPGDATNGLDVDVTRLPALGTINAGNSTTTPLGISGNFTGTYVDVRDYASILVSLLADQASATDGLKFQWSSDGTNLDVEETAEIVASAGRSYSLAPRAQFFRVNYTNGGTGQATFRLETILRTVDVGPFIRPLDKLIDDTFFAQLGRSVLVAKRTDSAYGNIRSTNGNNLKVAVAEFDGASLPAGTNNIGDVDVLSLPATPAGTNLIGGVEIRGASTADVVTVAADAQSRPGLWAAVVNLIFNGSTWDRLRSIVNGLDSTGTGIPTAGIVGQLDDTATGTVTENQFAPVRISTRRALLVEGVASGTAIGVSLAAGTNTNEVVGDVAHDAAAAGNPVLLAGISQDTDDTAPPNRVSAEGDATRIATDRDGAAFVRPHGPQVWSYHEDSSAALTDATVHAAPGAGLSLYVGTIVISTGAATALNAFLEEGAAKVLGPYYLEAVAGRGLAIQFNPPKKITANTALTITTSAAIAHSIDITGFTAQG